MLNSEIKAIIDSFGSHLNVDLQQRGVEFSQLFKGYNHLLQGLLEKMPPMQISRLSQQNRGSPNGDGGSLAGNSSIELLENGIDDIEKHVDTESNSHSVSSFY